jgi:hypothetical protein
MTIMKCIRFGSLALALAYAGVSGVAQAAPAPGSGEYMAQAFASTVSDPTNCFLQKNAPLNGVLSYGGIKAPVFTVSLGAAPSIFGGPAVANFKFNVVKGAGKTTQSGKLTMNVATPQAELIGHGTWTATFTEVTLNTFMTTIAVKFTAKGFSPCAAEIDGAFVKIQGVGP